MWPRPWCMEGGEGAGRDERGAGACETTALTRTRPSLVWQSPSIVSSMRSWSVSRTWRSSGEITGDAREVGGSARPRTSSTSAACFSPPPWKSPASASSCAVWLATYQEGGGGDGGGGQQQRRQQRVELVMVAVDGGRRMGRRLRDARAVRRESGDDRRVGALVGDGKPRLGRLGRQCRPKALVLGGGGRREAAVVPVVAETMGAQLEHVPGPCPGELRGLLEVCAAVFHGRAKAAAAAAAVTAAAAAAGPAA